MEPFILHKLISLFRFDWTVSWILTWHLFQAEKLITGTDTGIQRAFAAGYLLATDVSLNFYGVASCRSIVMFLRNCISILLF